MNKEKMIAGIAEMLKDMYIEDIEFFYNMMRRFLEKKGRKRA